MVKLELYPNSHCSFSPCTHIKYCDTGCEVLDSMDVYFFFRHLYVVGKETKRQLKEKKRILLRHFAINVCDGLLVRKIKEDEYFMVCYILCFSENRPKILLEQFVF